ncbi:MAG: CGLD27 family protein [Jaaginema sp. PMC 1079.18]|nr:CGLD27 family protein [Jaaginema sp. PMC 1080.18]MEC4851178.1 CGLD27 family protein [Jaaginema sp. PMC 1079.18]MEC4866119.1 CGLD27 family protein [Jaaginema sp. PMC 1078.18]
MKEMPLSVCPVPTEQQPVNEYEQLKESFFFRWTTLNGWAYVRQLLWIWAWMWVLVGPIASASFPLNRQPLKFALAGSGGALVFVVLWLVRLYLGWLYVRDRLGQATVTYEESGWYDGQIWEKPPETIVRDRLIVTYEIQPILNRIEQAFAVVALLIGIGSILWVSS